MAAFLDTNVLLYAYSSVNDGETEKVETAKQLVDRLTCTDSLIVSAQVLSEFVSVASRKRMQRLTIAEIAKVVELLSTQTVIPIDASLVRLALERTKQSRISYWDALIVEAAIRSGATTLYTEDMHHGIRYGGLQLLNPFIS